MKYMRAFAVPFSHICDQDVITKPQRAQDDADTLDHMKRTLALIAAPILAISLAACSSSDSNDAAEEVVVTEQTQSEEEVVTEEETEVVVEITDGNPTFGDTYTWPDGLAITISQPQEFTPSEYMGDIYDLEAGTPIKFTVTATNGTDTDLEAFSIDTQMSSGGKQSEAIFDSEAGIDMPTVAILPGNSLEWSIGFIVADPSNMQLSVSDVMNFDSEKIHFTN